MNIKINNEYFDINNTNSKFKKTSQNNSATDELNYPENSNQILNSNMSSEEKLFNFIERSDSDSIKRLLRADPKMKFWEYLDAEGYTIITKLAYADLDIIFEFIEIAKENLNEKQLKAYINKKASNGFTALHYSAFRGKVKLCEKLIENFADLNVVNNNGLNLIHMAAQGDQPETLVLFKDKYKIDPAITDNVFSTPIHWASYMGSDIALDYLASWGLDINNKDKDGFTPLHLAVMTGIYIIYLFFF